MSSPPRAPRVPTLDPARILALVRAAIEEDVGRGDITTEAVVGSDQIAEGRLVAREDLVVCGLPIARAVFLTVGSDLDVRELASEGSDATAGETIATVVGRARAILAAERTALNILQRLSGIATLSRRSVREVEGTGAIVLDTRKTTPTLRDVEKYAVAVGGATNHRMGLHDAVLIKDNHVALCGGVGEAVRRALAAGHVQDALEVEVDDLAGLREALAAGARHVLLDNASVEDVRRAAALVQGRATLEVSGGLAPGRLRAYAEAGAHRLSIGALTHSARAVDIALEVRPRARA